MVSIARKNLFQDKGRFLISVGGVAFAVLLISLLQGLYQGWDEKLTVYIDSVETDLWVVQKGTQDMFHTPSIIPEIYEDKIKEIDGVLAVNRLLGRGIMVDFSGEKELIILMGFDTETGVGGPAEVIKGSSKPSDSEVIIDKVFAKNNNLKIGDEIEIGDQREKIIGIASGGDMAMAQVAYVNINEARRIFGLKDVVNYFLVKINQGRDINIVKMEIEKNVENIDALSVSKFAQNNKKIVLGSFLPILAVLVIIGFIIGVAVIGLTIYTLTQEKIKEYGILKAIGASNRKLYSIVFQQSVISGVIGFFIGVVLSYIVAFFAGQIVPEFVVSFHLINFVWIFASAILMGIIASYIPVRKMAGIDPAIVFKG